ncbi:MAG TPA: serine/threonine-protein kinase [Gemmataceae bacterium]|nr:serine/threonine-protein kinase [Gemmataceae bacterium]
MHKPRMTQGVEPCSVETFLKSILRSGVLGRDELRQALRAVPSDQREDAEALADHLVDTGKLSRFQASKLLRGMAVGLVLGPFHVLAPIGKGGMGTVYLARDSRSQALVALKVLPPKRARAEQRLLARFRREMEMCQRVAHPHVAWTYEVGLCQGVYYIAMEYIPGKNLYRLVSEEGPLPVRRAARLFGEVATALDHAHNQGLIHRDLKPSNIIITPHDHAKVLDLGLAIVQGEVPAEREVIGGRGYVVGTMDYIAPEQAEDAAKVDPRSDIYSLGCTLYYALTGQPPFPGGTAVEKIQRHRGEDPVPVPQLNPAVPPAFIGLLRKMMAKDPAQRIATAAEVQERLLPWASGDVVLPLDRQGDQEYQQAIAELESAEVPLDLIAEVIPVGIPEPPKRRIRVASQPDAAASVPLPREVPGLFSTRFRWLLGLGALFLISLALGGLLALMLLW